ncbi:hypothetical protein TCDM_09400 [Trypanosoma cruzi Dm28c]|uniref:Uncharacterized protein n=1 Tax=Trypanosoma cruzi Dm28c TaxID=1416333 RepID=V5D5X6_TRYCR|nr:hypothetical protein TCDM_09400 [Trypanosoma cruzi Dm28c]
MATDVQQHNHNCQHALQKEHSNPPQCASCVCVWLCVPAETQSKEVEKGAECVEGRTKCTAETHNGNNNKKTAQTDDRSAAQAAAIHTRFIENKKKFPLVLCKPHHTK